MIVAACIIVMQVNAFTSTSFFAGTMKYKTTRFELKKLLKEQFLFKYFEAM